MFRIFRETFLTPMKLPFYFLVMSAALSCTTPSESQTDSLENSYLVLVVEQGKSQVKVFDLKGSLVDTVQVGYNPHEIEWDAAEGRAYVSNFGVEDYDNTLGIPGNSIAVINPENLSEITSWSTFREGIPEDSSKGPHGLKLRPNHQNELFVNLEYGDAMLIFDTRTGKITRSFPIPKASHNFIFSPDGTVLWLMAGTNGLYEFDPDTGEELAHFPVQSALRGLELTRDGKKLLLSCQNELYLLNSSHLELIKHYTDLGVKQIIYSCFSPDESLLFAPCPYDNKVLVIAVETGTILQELHTGKAPISVKISRDQTKAFVANALDDHMSVIDLKDYSISSFGSVFKPNGFLFWQRRNKSIYSNGFGRKKPIRLN